MHPDHDTVPAQLCAAFDRHRDRPALGDGGLRLTYGALAGFVAACRPVLPATGTVAVYGVPGTLFAALATACVVGGRPFVHLDPAMPDAVLDNTLVELDVELVLAAEPTRGRPLAGRRQVAGETFLGATADGPVLPAAVRPGDPIYVVATSGTTGRPKCIPVTHDAAALSYAWRETILPYRPGMAVGAYIFAIWEMFRPLRHGAEVAFPALRDLLTPRGFGAFLGGARVSEMLFTPSFLSRILAGLDAGEAARLPLRRIVLNGEVVEDRLVEDLARKLPQARVWNLYSICETHDVAMRELGRSAPGGTDVGRAMPHIAPVVLDDDDRPLPAGATGRLHFEGPRMLGPGYVARPEETARRFRTLTVDGRAARLYDTGDLGRVGADGRIVVLGRAAHMLKLRGHSIQTAELVAALGDALAFSQAVPRVVQVGGHERLAIYYAADDDQAARNRARWDLGFGQQRLPDALARALAAALPEYCVPRHLVGLAAMPIHDVSGKLDLKALPAIGAAPSEGETGVPALAEAARILGMGSVAVDGNGSFRDHGGDSLMCVDLMMSLEAAYGRRVDFDWAMDLPLGRLHDLLSGEDAAPGSARFSGRGILVTGATGFLGRHVLRAAHAALPATASIFCLVRPGRETPADRLAALAAETGLPEGRLSLVAGRLDAPDLGLGAAGIDDLARRVTSVVHCAATVNLALDGERMEAGTGANLDPLLDLCRRSGADLRFTSSSAVFPDRGGPHPEGPARAAPRTGYGRAKAAAETLIAAAGVDAAILRLPSLYDLDAPNPGDIYETVLAASRAMRAVPAELTFPMVDVRKAAAFLVGLSRPAGVSYLNLFAEDPVAPAYHAPDCRAMPVDEWRARAPITALERRLLTDDPEMLRADARFDTGRARDAWQAAGLGPWAGLADPVALLSRRLVYQSEPAFT